MHLTIHRPLVQDAAARAARAGSAPPPLPPPRPPAPPRVGLRTVAALALARAARRLDRDTARRAVA